MIRRLTRVACLSLPFIATGSHSALAVHHGRCCCCPPKVIVHVCKTAGENGTGAETGSQAGIETAQVVPTTPVFGFGAMQMAYPAMPYPVMPATYGVPSFAPVPNNGRETGARDCCDKLDRLEQQMENLKDEMERLIDVVDDHGRVLEELVKRAPKGEDG